MPKAVFLLAMLVALQAYLTPESFRTNFHYSTLRPSRPISPSQPTQPTADKCWEDNTIKVSGSAKIEVEPDTAVLSASL